MQFLLLIYHPESDWIQLPTEERQLIYREYRQLLEELSQSGKFLAGDQLKASQSGKTVRVRNGKVTARDGPFAETKEQLGGYFLLELTSMDEAVSIAARIPSSSMGSVEIREVSPRERV